LIGHKLLENDWNTAAGEMLPAGPSRNRTLRWAMSGARGRPEAPLRCTECVPLGHFLPFLKDAIGEDGKSVSNELVRAAVKRAPDELLVWAGALKVARSV